MAYLHHLSGLMKGLNANIALNPIYNDLKTIKREAIELLLDEPDSLPSGKLLQFKNSLSEVEKRVIAQIRGLMTQSRPQAPRAVVDRRDETRSTAVRTSDFITNGRRISGMAECYG